MSDRLRSRFGQKMLHRAAACAAVCALVSYAHGQIVYEPFDMPTGSLGGNANGLSGVHWVYGAAPTQDMQVVNQNTVPASGASQVIAANGLENRGRDDGGGAINSVEHLGISDYTSGDLYLSARITVHDITFTDSSSAGGFFTGFALAPGSSTSSVNFAGARIRLKKSSATTFILGIQNDVHNGQGTLGIGSANNAFIGTNFPLDTPITIVARYHFSPNNFADDVASLWAEPVTDAQQDASFLGTLGAPEAPAPDAASGGCDTIDVGDPMPTIRSAFLRQNSVGASDMFIDDFRIGRTWASVTPKSGTTWNSTSDAAWGGSNWSDGVPDAANSYAYFDDSSAVHNVSVDGTRTVGSMFITSASGYNFAGGNLVFDGGMGTTVHGSSGITVNALKDGTFTNILPSSNTISSNVTLNNDLYVSVGAGQSLTMSGNIAQSTASALNKYGGGTLALSGNNSYSGGVGIYDGTLLFNSLANLGIGNQIVLDGGTMVPGGPMTFTQSFLLGATGTLDTGASNLAITGSITGDGTLTKQGSGALTINSFKGGGLIVSGGAVALAAGRDTANKTIVLTRTVGVNTAGGASLDLGNNDLIFNYLARDSFGNDITDPAKLAAIKALIISGYNGGAWNGPGIISSAAQADHRTGLAYAEASAVPGSPASFDGVNSDVNMVVVRYTWLGDANLTGTVDTSDFTILSQNFGMTAQDWITGDFNYDGVVNALDFNALATNFGAAAIPSAVAGTLVPEPVSLSTIGLLWLGVSRRRRQAARNRLRAQVTKIA